MPDHVGVVEADDAIFIARLPDGPIIRLSGTATMIWTAALQDGDRLVSLVSAAVGVPDAAIVDDVDDFISDLIDGGLLVNRDVGRY